LIALNYRVLIVLIGGYLADKYIVREFTDSDLYSGSSNQSWTMGYRLTSRHPSSKEFMVCQLLPNEQCPTPTSSTQ